MTAENETMPPAAGNYVLRADRAELLAAFTSITTFKKRTPSGRLKLTFAEGNLQLSMPGVDIAVTAQGDWPGEVWVKAGIVWGLAAVPPTGDPVSVSFQGGRVRIGTSSAVATSQRGQKL